MAGLNRAISTAVNALCLRLLQLNNAPVASLPYRLEQSLGIDSCPEQGLNQRPDLVAWLAAQQQYPKFFWRSRDRHTQVASLGMARLYQDQQAATRLDAGITSEHGLRYYWLSGFDLHGDAVNSAASAKFTAADYPRQLLFLPEIALTQEQDSLTLSVTLTPDSDIGALATHLRQLKPSQPLSSSAIKVSQRQDSPDFDQWQRSLQQAKRGFTTGLLQKVVLARQSTFHYPAAADSIEGATDRSTDRSSDYWQLFNRWRRASVNSYQIGYQPSANRGFMSFSPERLFHRDGSTLTTEALAGTQARSADDQLARAPATTLLGDSKNRYEHGLVVVEIGAKLEGLGVDISVGQGTGVLNQAGLQHLHQPIRGQLPCPGMDAQLLRTLHPTAAIGGLPTEPARLFIRDHEPIGRGLYAGCCGYLGADRSELAVTIRSAKFHYPQLTLYAGAGIVPQSDAVLEWQELEQKIALPLSLFEQPLLNQQELEPQPLVEQQPLFEPSALKQQPRPEPAEAHALSPSRLT